MGSGTNSAPLDVERFVKETGPRIKQALIASFGGEVGREATAEALSYAWTHWDRIEAMRNPAGYVFQVGRNWACPPCVDNLAIVDALAGRWPDVALVSVLTANGTPETAESLAQTIGFGLPIVVDETGNLWNAQMSIPGYVLIDEEGRAVAGFRGSISQADLSRLIELFL